MPLLDFGKCFATREHPSLTMVACFLAHDGLENSMENKTIMTREIVRKEEEVLLPKMSCLSQREVNKVSMVATSEKIPDCERSSTAPVFCRASILEKNSEFVVETEQVAHRLGGSSVAYQEMSGSCEAYAIRNRTPGKHTRTAPGSPSLLQVSLGSNRWSSKSTSCWKHHKCQTN